MMRYFAIVNRRRMFGFAMDYYPEEAATIKKYWKKHIVGDLFTPTEAYNCVRRHLEELASIKNQKNQCRAEA